MDDTRPNTGQSGSVTPAVEELFMQQAADHFYIVAKNFSSPSTPFGGSGVM
tara:strand:- start:199 stop:351 length:153 start_codon:yes stop_codon:yes gene_type:complete